MSSKVVIPILVNLDSVSNVRVASSITNCKIEVVDTSSAATEGVSRTRFKTAALEDVEIPTITVYPITLREYINCTEELESNCSSFGSIYSKLEKMDILSRVNVGVLLVELENLPIEPVREDLTYKEYEDQNIYYKVKLFDAEVTEQCRSSRSRPRVKYNGSTTHLYGIPPDVIVDSGTYESVIAKYVRDYKIERASDILRMGSNLDKVDSINLNISLKQLSDIIGLQHLLPGKFTSLKKLKANDSNVATLFCDMFNIEHLDTLSIRNGVVDMGCITVDNLHVRGESEVEEGLLSSLKSLRVRMIYGYDSRGIIKPGKCRTDNDIIEIDSNELATVGNTHYYPLVNLTKLNKDNCGIAFKMYTVEGDETEYRFSADLNLNLTASFVTRVKSAPSAKR